MRTVSDCERARFPWLFTLLLLSCVTLFFQVFPAVWWRLMEVIDVRYWTWRSAAVANVVVIAALVALKGWYDYTWNDR